MTKLGRCIAFLFLSFNLICFGQGLRKEFAVNDNYTQSIDALASTENATYFIKNSSGSSHSIIKVDTAGQILWEKKLSTQLWAGLDVYEIIVSPNNRVFILGYGRPVCDVGGNCSWFIEQYKPNGDFVWEKKWSSPQCQLRMSGFSVNPGNEINVDYYLKNADSSIIYTLNSSGVLTDSLKVTQTKLKGIETFSGNKKVVFTKDSIFGLNADGTVFNTISFSKEIQDLSVNNDSLFVLTKDSVFLFDTNFQLLKKASFSGYSNYSRLKVNPNNIRFLSSATTYQDILTISHSLTLKKVKTIPISLPSNAKKDFGGTHFSTGMDFNLTHFTSIRYLEYDLQSNQNWEAPRTDIGVIGFQPTKIGVKAVADVDYVYSIDIYGKVLIKNFGNKTLHSCYLNHYFSQAPGCFINGHLEYYSNLNLAPNDTTWLSFGQSYSKTLYYPKDGDTITANVCVFTSSPNNVTDLTVSNDKYCKKMTIGYAGINTQMLHEVVLYPNPVDDVLTIELEKKKDFYFTISNVQGLTVKKGKLDSPKIDVSNLAKGMYILRLSTKTGIVKYQSKLIKK